MTAWFQSVEDLAQLGQEMHQLIAELYPICRSITGNGLRKTLRCIQRQIPVDLHEVPTGTPIFDWTVPKEWNVRDAFVKNSRGERVIDFQKSNLHVVNYSIPVHRRMSLAQLKEHLFTLPDRVDWIPYRTSYYNESWGFCLAHREFENLQEDEYEVRIDSSLENGHLTYGECFLPGESSYEILISSHSCHPSLCNDNLSGIAVATALARHLKSVPHRYSYRFLFIPGTIGSIAWLSLNEERLSNIKHGLVLAGVGDLGNFSYKRSRQGNADIDRAAAQVLKHNTKQHRVLDFSPYGYDERQFCSPGINLPVGRLSRTPHGEFPEYHTSADSLDFVHPSSLAESFSVCLSILSILECDSTYLNLNPKCEPQLGKRGLYRAMGGHANAAQNELAMLWVLNLSDGWHTVLDIAERSGLSFEIVNEAVAVLKQHDLLRECLENAAAPTR